MAMSFNNLTILARRYWVVPPCTGSSMVVNLMREILELEFVRLLGSDPALH
jgi:hypothetical protein